MAVSKDDVRGFVDKVKDKAVHSVKERHDELINQEIRRAIIAKYPMAAHLYERIQEVLVTLNALRSELKPIINSIPKIEESNGRYYYHNDDYWTDLSGRDGEAAPDFLIKTIGVHSNDVRKIGKVEEMIAARDAEVKEVETNYRNLKSTLETLKSARKMMDYLEKLGFDIASLEYKEDKVLPVDTTKLFVCGEKA